MVTVKRAISDTMRRETIEEITILEGQRVHYSGLFEKLTSGCDPDMIIYRDALLKRVVESKTLFNHRKLFIFIKEATP